MREKEENYFIDFLRFVFSICIVIYHGRVFAVNEYDAILINGHFGVDFYFVVTGYLMMNTIFKTKKSTMFKNYFTFIYKKIKKLVPGLLLACLIGALLVYKGQIVSDPIKVISQMLIELSQLGVFGFIYEINCSWWYISAMILVILLLYPLANKFREKYCYFIAPVILLIAYLFVYFNKININAPFVKSTFVINGFYKGLLFIALGNIAFILTKLIKKYFSKKNKNVIFLLSFIEIFIYIIILLNLHFIFNNHYTFIVNSIFAVLLTISVSLSFSGITYTSKLFKNDIWKKLGKYGFYLYLCNTSVRVFLLNKYTVGKTSYWLLLSKLIILSCLIGLIIYLIVEKLINKKTR